MFTTLFLAKYLFRVMHIGSLVLICHAVITAKMTGQIVKDHHALYMSAGILVIVSGLVNTFILKPKEMGQKRKLWLAYNHTKALTAIIIFTPLAKMLPITVEEKIDVQFYWMLTVLVLSPFARFYREHFVAVEKSKRERELKDADSTSL